MDPLFEHFVAKNPTFLMWSRKIVLTSLFSTTLEHKGVCTPKSKRYCTSELSIAKENSLNKDWGIEQHSCRGQYTKGYDHMECYFRNQGRLLWNFRLCFTNRTVWISPHSILVSCYWGILMRIPREFNDYNSWYIVMAFLAPDVNKSSFSYKITAVCWADAQLCKMTHNCDFFWNAKQKVSEMG